VAVLGSVNVIESELWPQRDARDPLGIFGWRVTQAADASGGSNKILVQVPELLRHAFVYKIYSMTLAQTVGTVVSQTLKLRVLTNWPNVDIDPGIQAYGAFWMGSGDSDVLFTVPAGGISNAQPFIDSIKDLLIYDPSTQTGDMVIAEQETANTDGQTWSFEGYGYYWDRAVMSTPGGPRNPGTA